jgi:hypothetical protein
MQESGDSCRAFTVYAITAGRRFLHRPSVSQFQGMVEVTSPPSPARGMALDMRDAFLAAISLAT